jgi:hypothetical protein
MKRAAPLMLASLLLPACDTSPVTVARDYGRVPSLSAAPGGNPRATGSGHFETAGELRTFAFNAIQHKDGIVTGHSQTHNRVLDVSAHLEIDCLRFLTPNSAVMSGTITRSNDPTLEGRRGIFRVEDNGEGANDPPDGASLTAVLPPGSMLDCQVLPGPNPIPIQHGNVQVSP